MLPKDLAYAALHRRPVRNIDGTVLDRGLPILAATIPDQGIQSGCIELGTPGQDEGRTRRVAQDFSGPDSAERAGATGNPVNALVLPGRGEVARLFSRERHLFEHATAAIPVGNLHIIRVCVLVQQLTQSRGALRPLQQDHLTADGRVFEVGTTEDRCKSEPELRGSRVCSFAGQHELNVDRLAALAKQYALEQFQELNAALFDLSCVPG